MSWNPPVGVGGDDGGGGSLNPSANPYSPLPHQQQLYQQQQPPGMILQQQHQQQQQQQSPPRQLHGGGGHGSFAGGEYPLQHDSQQNFSGGVVSPPSHGGQDASVSWGAARPPPQQHPGAVQPHGIGYPMMQAQALYPWQHRHQHQHQPYLDPQQQGMSYNNPAAASGNAFNDYRASLLRGGSAGAGGRDGGRRGRDGRGAGAGVAAGEAAGDKKRGRGDESESRGKGKGRATSKGGSKVSRREAEGGGGRAGQGAPPLSASDDKDDDEDEGGDEGSTPLAGANSVHRPTPSRNASDGAGQGARPATMADVNRAAGEGHWTNIMNNAANVNPIELNPAKRAAKAAAELAAQGGGRSGKGGAPAPGSDAGPPKPMKEDPPGSGKMVLDEEAHQRMYPGGAVLNLKAFKLKQKSAVSAAFELCVAMEPKARPHFEFKDDRKTSAAPFTLHVAVNGVAYSSATARSIKLAKQLACVTFLREVMGTREQLNLESLIAEAGGDAAGKNAVAAAIGKKTKKPAAAEGGGAEAGGGGGGSAGEEEEGDPQSEDSEAVANLALENGLPNYAQLLHDLTNAHPETPTYASYSFKATKDSPGRKQLKARAGGFKCAARLLHHKVDKVEVETHKKEEEEKRLIDEEARKLAEANPGDVGLVMTAKKAHDDYNQCRAKPLLSISCLSSTGREANKRDAKHKAAEGMIHLLLPGCKDDETVRAKAKAIIDDYQEKKKARMGEEQRAAQRNKALREAAQAARERARAARAAQNAAAIQQTEAEAIAAGAAAGESETDVMQALTQPPPPPPSRHAQAVQRAVEAAAKKANTATAGAAAGAAADAAGAAAAVGGGAAAAASAAAAAVGGAAAAGAAGTGSGAGAAARGRANDGQQAGAGASAGGAGTAGVLPADGQGAGGSAGEAGGGGAISAAVWGGGGAWSSPPAAAPAAGSAGVASPARASHPAVTPTRRSTRSAAAAATAASPASPAAAAAAASRASRPVASGTRRSARAAAAAASLSGGDDDAAGSRENDAF